MLRVAVVLHISVVAKRSFDCFVCLTGNPKALWPPNEVCSGCRLNHKDADTEWDEHAVVRFLEVRVGCLVYLLSEVVFFAGWILRRTRQMQATSAAWWRNGRTDKIGLATCMLWGCNTRQLYIGQQDESRVLL